MGFSGIFTDLTWQNVREIFKTRQVCGHKTWNRESRMYTQRVEWKIKSAVQEIPEICAWNDSYVLRYLQKCTFPNCITPSKFHTWQNVIKSSLLFLRTLTMHLSYLMSNSSYIEVYPDDVFQNMQDLFCCCFFVVRLFVSMDNKMSRHHGSCSRKTLRSVKSFRWHYFF